MHTNQNAYYALHLLPRLEGRLGGQAISTKSLVINPLSRFLPEVGEFVLSDPRHFTS
jgi:hypothetical protein